MPDIKAKISQSGLLKGNANSQNEIVASKVEVNTAGINFGDLINVTLTSPSDGSYVIFQNSTGTFIDDQTIVKTSTGITLTGSLAVTTDIDVDGTLEADAITVNGIQLSEVISDTVGAMVGSNTESGIAVSYDDSDNTLDFNVDDFTITLTGDVAGSGTVTNLGDVSFATVIQPNSVALGTDTTGDYVGTITGGTGIDSTAATSGEGTTHTLSIDLNELGTETSIAQADFIAMVDATDNGSGKITFSNLEDEIFGNVSGDIAIAAGGAATIQATSVENSMLAGFITNDKLSNSTVSYGGISLALGANDDTPAFNLQDATNLPTSALTGDMPNARIVVGNVTQHQSSLSVATTQLTGTITNTQLAGSITNDKLSNSTVNFGGVSVALGASDTTPAFDLQHATNLPTSALTGDMPNARIIASNVTQHQAALSIATTQLTGTITNAQLANSSITVSDGSNTSPVALGGTLTFAGTSNEVTVAENAGTITVGLPDDVTVGGDLVITGDLTVNGTETILNSTTLSVDDKNIVLGSIDTPTDTTADGGGITLKGTTDKTLNWVDSTDSWTSSEHFEVASAKTFRINGNEVLSQTTLGSTVLASSLTSVGALDSGSITSNFSDIDIGDNVVTAAEFVGDLRGAVRFQAKAGEALTKGDVVYISGVNGQKPIVSKAQANSAATMPSFGLANATVNNNANLEVISFGTFAHGDTSGGDENWAFGDVLYVSAATAGALTKVKPAGAANLIQNVGKVERVHGASGSIMVAGAGRTAATPNLDDGKFFIGDSNNYSTIGSFNNQFTNTSGTISLNGANITTVGTIGTGVWQGTAIANNYIGSLDASKITTGTINNDRLPAAATNITSVGNLTSLNINPPVGTGGSLTMTSRGGSASFFLAGVGSPGDADYVAPGSFTVTDASNATIISDAITLVGPTAVNAALTVNDNSFEVVSTTDDVNANPIVSLYRNRANPAAGDLIGEIQFNGEDSASNKTLYAAIIARASDETNPDEEDGQLFTYLAKQGVKTHITSVFNYGVVYQPGIHQYLTGSGKLQIAAGNSGGFYNALYSVTPTANRSVLLPDADGTIVLKDSTDILTNKSINANQLTDTIDNARLPAAATNITSVGNLTGLTIALPAGTTGHFLPVKLGTGSLVDSISDSSDDYNYAIGENTLESLTNGENNIAFGLRAMQDTTSGSRNTVIGHISGQHISTGNENIFIGYAVAESATVTGANNLGMVGPNLRNLTSGNHNIALGKQAGDHITTGNYNIALGFQAMDGNSGAITGGDNIAIGRYSLYNNTTGQHNIGIGYRALYSTDTDSYYNVGIGYQAGDNLTTGDYNYFVGHSAGKNATTASHQLAIGYQSGGGYASSTTTGGSSGIAIGYRAAGNDTASHNIALGYQALRNNDDSNSYYVTAIQREALYKARKTPHCVAIGYQSQYENVHSEDNVSIGENALKEAGYGIVIDATSSSVVDLTNNRFTISNTDFGYLNHRASGFHNNTRLRYYANGGTPIGGLTEGTSYYVTNDSTASAMYLATSTNKTSSNAVALTSLGVGSGHYFSVQGENNVVIGNEAGKYGRQFFQSVAIGSRAGRGTQNDCSHEATVNVGYAAGYNSQKSRYATHMGYLAGYTATDNYMRTSIGARAGVYSTASYETAIGAYALSANSSANSTGDHNTAVGYASLNHNTSGKFNSSVGSYSLFDNTTGQRNTVVGYNTAANVTTGSYNTVLGMQAGVDLTTGGYNTIVGSYAGDELIGGSNNTVMGYAAYQHSAGKLNTAIGNGAMNNTGGSGDSPYANTAVGATSLKSLQNGASGNIGLGLQALPGCTTGDYNIGIGYKSGENLTTGSYNIAIGRENDFSTANAFGQIVIGRGCATTENYQVAIGYTNGVIRNEFDTDATWTQSSDLRKKKNINDMNLGLEFIDKLRPITYQWKPNNELPEQFDEYAEENTKDTETVMSGLGAQDVKQALEEVGYTERFPGWKEDTDGSQRISKEEFVIPLINAIQELKAEVEMLKEKLNNGDS